MLVGALRVFPRTVLPRHRPKSSMRQTGADSPAPSQTVHWTVCVPLWRERAVRIPSLREKQKALSPDGERAFCGRSDGIRTHGLLVPNQARYQLRYTPSARLLYVFSVRMSRCILQCGYTFCSAGTLFSGVGMHYLAKIRKKFDPPHRTCEKGTYTV